MSVKAENKVSFMLEPKKEVKLNNGSNGSANSNDDNNNNSRK